MDAEKLLMQLVNDQLLTSVDRRHRVAFQNPSVDINAAPVLDMNPSRQRMNFGVLRSMDNTLQVKQSASGVVRLITRKQPLIQAGINFLQQKHPGHRIKMAADFLSQGRHPGHNIRMSEDILSFEPEEGLINMSENPLWIVQPEDEFQVAIKRIF